MLEYDERIHANWYVTAYNLGHQCYLDGGSEADNIYNNLDDLKRYTAWKMGFRECLT